MKADSPVTVWAGIALSCVLVLSFVDLLRTRLPGSGGVLVDTAPNFLAVVALTFFYLGAIARKRDRAPKSLGAHFRFGLTVATLGTLMWEFIQPFGGHVFDPADLVATGLGAAASVGLFTHVSGRQGRAT